ncbi:MAG: hypothetical protein JO138_16510 [Acidobacteriaceae bacterium]|nr:hypothetical protein [Acidobacteriaceae bacterium]
MKTTQLAAVLAIAETTFCAGKTQPPVKATVIICLQSDPHFQFGIRPLASAMFGNIGVRIDWRELDSCPEGVGAIRVSASYNSRGSHKLQTLAYAQPFGDSIVVFPDRINELNRAGGPSVLAHVLVHEIAHMLEGIPRHSSSGIMKERWNDHDYQEMRRKPLHFAPDDIELIYSGLKARQSRIAGTLAPGNIAGH